MDTTIQRGLDGVVIDSSRICFIDGLKGELIYRGYDIRELADKASFEETVYLLWNGQLPKQGELEAFKAELKPHFAVPDDAIDVLRHFPQEESPMHALRTAVSLLAASDLESEGVDLDNVRRIGLKLTAQVVTLTAALQRLRSAQEPVAPHPDLGLAANFLYMTSGEEPSAAAVRVMDVALVLHAEHGSNASTFVARATASTLTDVYSAVVAAIGSLKGPLHGGANTAVMQMLEEIGSVEAVESFVMDKLSQPKARIPGFGHRVYRVLDPRAAVLEEVSEKLAEESGDAKWFLMSQEVERVMGAEMDRRGKQVRPNVDFFSASVYRMLGFPAEMYTPIFTVARTPGWAAHLLEQYADNRLMRPKLAYEGEKGKTFVPIESR